MRNNRNDPVGEYGQTSLAIFFDESPAPAIEFEARGGYQEPPASPKLENLTPFWGAGPKSDLKGRRQRRVGPKHP